MSLHPSPPRHLFSPAECAPCAQVKRLPHLSRAFREPAPAGNLRCRAAQEPGFQSGRVLARAFSFLDRSSFTSSGRHSETRLQLGQRAVNGGSRGNGGFSSAALSPLVFPTRGRLRTEKHN